MNRENRKLAVIAILAFVLISANIGGYSIYITDEARNAQCAREMLERGDMVVPTFNQTLRTDKPPLHYFFMASAYTTLGVSPFAASIFS
jgi:4-amino-4-deoxy-L-arabinose transferase-like glycosyltransferase